MKYHQKQWTYGLLTFCGCVTCAIVAHYAEYWGAFIYPAFIVSMFGALSVGEY